METNLRDVSDVLPLLHKLRSYLDNVGFQLGWRNLASRLGYDYNEIQIFDAPPTPQYSPTVQLLSDWMMKSDSTVERLIYELNVMNNDAAVKEITKHLNQKRDNKSSTPNQQTKSVYTINQPANTTPTTTNQQKPWSSFGTQNTALDNNNNNNTGNAGESHLKTTFNNSQTTSNSVPKQTTSNNFQSTSNQTSNSEYPNKLKPEEVVNALQHQMTAILFLARFEKLIPDEVVQGWGTTDYQKATEFFLYLHSNKLNYRLHKRVAEILEEKTLGDLVPYLCIGL